MKRVLVTGMSGTGKSTVLAELARRGHRVVDTDYGDWVHDVRLADGSLERMWREDRIVSLLEEHRDGSLFVAGCVANQVRFYDRFDAVVLLTLPVDMLLDRVASRTTNPFGKEAAERDRILDDLAAVEPSLRRDATLEISTDQPLENVGASVERLASERVG